MNNDRTVWKFVAGIFMVVLIAAFSPGFVNRDGGVTMTTEYVKTGGTLWKDLLVNGDSASGTSTSYNLGAHSYFGFGYDIKQATSTPHMRIEWFEGTGISKEHIFWETLPAGTITASDETNVNPQTKTFNPAVTQWIYFKWQGLTLNATGTTFRAWFTRQ